MGWGGGTRHGLRGSCRHGGLPGRPPPRPGPSWPSFLPPLPLHLHPRTARRKAGVQGGQLAFLPNLGQEQGPWLAGVGPVTPAQAGPPGQSKNPLAMCRVASRKLPAAAEGSGRGAKLPGTSVLGRGLSGCPAHTRCGVGGVTHCPASSGGVRTGCGPLHLPPQGLGLAETTHRDAEREFCSWGAGEGRRCWAHSWGSSSSSSWSPLPPGGAVGDCGCTCQCWLSHRLPLLQPHPPQGLAIFQQDRGCWQES